MGLVLIGAFVALQLLLILAMAVLSRSDSLGPAVCGSSDVARRGLIRQSGAVVSVRVKRSKPRGGESPIIGPSPMPLAPGPASVVRTVRASGEDPWM
jgi:hypothetical protein